jgi:hypothetical protein
MFLELVVVTALGSIYFEILMEEFKPLAADCDTG